MELQHFFAKEIVAPSHKKLEHLFVVKSGKLQLVDDRNNLVAVYEAGMTIGASEILGNKPLQGNLMAMRPSTVLALDKDLLLAELDGIADHVRLFFSSISDSIARRAANI
jgi:signal-transduction protein with cAMP-binding, CBS, and nucleotidyltransferase domain